MAISRIFFSMGLRFPREVTGRQVEASLQDTAKIALETKGVVNFRKT